MTSSQPITVCQGFGGTHKPKPMKLVGFEDDGTHIWKCPRCHCVWRERPETVAISRGRDV